MLTHYVNELEAIFKGLRALRALLRFDIPFYGFVNALDEQVH